MSLAEILGLLLAMSVALNVASGAYLIAQAAGIGNAQASSRERQGRMAPPGRRRRTVLRRGRLPSPGGDMAHAVHQYDHPCLLFADH